jgi:hypothetical protein
MKKLLLIILGLLLIGSAKAQMEGDQIDYHYLFSTKIITQMDAFVEKRDSTGAIVTIIAGLPDGYNINDVMYHTKYLLQLYDEYLTVAVPWEKKDNNRYSIALFLNPEMDQYLVLFYLADFNKILIMYNKQNYD